MTPFTAFATELISLIVNHLPRHARSSTCLALGLASRSLCQILIPDLLYNDILLDENQALVILADKSLSKFMQSITISFSLRSGGKKTRDVLDVLRDGVLEGAFPSIRSLGFHLLDGKDYIRHDRNNLPIDLPGLDVSFWSALEKGCPQLRNISLSGIKDDNDPHWFEHCGILNLENLTSFHLEYDRGPEDVEMNDPKRITLVSLLENLSVKSPDLTALSLLFVNSTFMINAAHGYFNHTDENQLFTRDFPNLRSLSLDRFTVKDTHVVMNFWNRHPRLERLVLGNCMGDCFDTSGKSPIRMIKLLPNLRILQADLNQIVEILPFVHSHLINLTIMNAATVQIRDTMGLAMPAPQHSVRSLSIGHNATYDSADIGSYYASWEIEGNYLLVMNEVTPNLEELELINIRDLGLSADKPQCLAKALSDYKNLKRLYLKQFTIPTEESKWMIEVATSCQSLESITLLTRFRSATCHLIHRSDEGITLTKKIGCGREIGMEDDTLPGVFQL